MRIIKVGDDEKLKFKELLLLADESIEMIEKEIPVPRKWGWKCFINVQP